MKGSGFVPTLSLTGRGVDVRAYRKERPPIDRARLSHTVAARSRDLDGLRRAAGYVVAPGSPSECLDDGVKCPSRMRSAITCRTRLPLDSTARENPSTQGIHDAPGGVHRRCCCFGTRIAEVGR